jgi:hypothetical protein
MASMPTSSTAGGREDPAPAKTGEFISLPLMVSPDAAPAIANSRRLVHRQAPWTTLHRILPRPINIQPRNQPCSPVVSAELG